MVKEILLRTYTPFYRDNLLEPLAKIIRDNTKFKVTLVDHTKISIEDFKLSVSSPNKYIVSIDRHVSEQLDIPYMRVSRIFRENGDVVGRLHICDGIDLHADNVTILDTDVISYNTFNYAFELFSPNTIVKSKSLLYLNEDQELIDIEDLYNCNSLCQYNGLIHPISYLHNTKFFEKRTSLPVSIFDEVKGLIKKFIG